MEPALDYLKRLFVSKDTPLGRADYLTTLGLLWFLNITVSSHVIPMMLDMMVARTLTQTQIAGMLLLGRFSNALFSISLPWSFALFIGSLLLMRRIYPKRMHPLFQVLGGISVFVFFRAALAIPLFSAGYLDPLTALTSALREVERSIAQLIAASVAIGAVGLCLLLVPLFRRDAAHVAGKTAVAHLLDRGAFARRYLFFSLVLALVTIITSLLLRFVFRSRLDNPLAWAVFGVIGASGTVVLLILMVRRIRDSGLSFWVLLVFAAALMVSAAGIVLAGFFRALLIHQAARVLIGIGFELTAVFLFWLFLAPGRKTR